MAEQQRSIRSFIALAISEDAREALQAAVQSVQGKIPQGMQWVRPEGIHLTLKFLGDIRPEMADRLLHALAEPAGQAAPFSVRLSGLGMFPNQRRPRVLWGGVAGDLDALAALYEKVETAAAGLGFAREARPYSPHLTLGRVRRGVSAAAAAKIGGIVAAEPPPEAPPWTVVSINLYQTTLRPDGAIHSVLGSLPLTGQLRTNAP